ncbi:LPS assembly lipoprotein LptE [Thermodesulfobacteriota bacterium]
MALPLWERSYRGKRWLWIGLFLLAAGCGYRFSTPTEADCPHPRLLFIPVFQNRTMESGLGSLVTNEVLAEIEQSNCLGVVERDQSGARVSGWVDSLTESSASRKAGGVSYERRIRLVVQAAVVDSDGRALWPESRLAEDDTYTVAVADKQITDARRRAALARVSRRLANKLRGLLETYLADF